MSWTTPRTWTTNELVTAALMNTHVKDNEDYLKARMPITHTANASSATTTTSATYGTIDTMTTTFTPVVTGKALCLLSVTADASDQNVDASFEILDATSGGTVGQPQRTEVHANEGQLMNVCVVGETAITAGTAITISGLWKVAAGTATMTYRVLHVTELCTE